MSKKSSGGAAESALVLRSLLWRRTEEDARRIVRQTRWPDGIACPFCDSQRVHEMSGLTQRGMFQCNACRKKFSERTRTGLQGSNIPLHKILLGIKLFVETDGQISANKLMELTEIGSYRTALRLHRQLREAMESAREDESETD